MKQFRTSTENLIKILLPDRSRFEETITPYVHFDQKRFVKFLDTLNLDIEGQLTQNEDDALKAIKKEMEELAIKYPSAPVERLEFDYAIILHKNLKELGFSKFHIDNLGMWRWLSLNYFLEEVSTRRAKKLIERHDYEGAAKAIFTHSFGVKTRDIFPRRYFLIGERLHDKDKGYNLLSKLAERCRPGRSGGFGNLVNNLIETSLLSPQDWVSKTMGKVLLTGEDIADNDEVANAFIRYNGYKKRLLNNATEKIFVDEICLMKRKIKPH